MSRIGDKVVYNLDEIFSDSDGEILSYSSEFTSALVVHVFPLGSKLTITAMSLGMTNIKLIATDAVGESCSTSFKVLVKEVNSKMDLYPNPVISKLNIQIGMEVSAIVSIIGSSGTVVHSSSYSMSPFTPLQIDMTHMSAGSYTVVLRYSDKQFTGNIVKL